MSTISLSFYTFQITDTAMDPPTAQLFTNLSGKALTHILYDYFKGTASEYQNDKTNERLFRTVSFNEYEHKHNNKLYFSSVSITVKTGNYGTEAELIDSEDTAQKRHIKATEAAILPFSFGIYYNPLKDTALLVTQSISRNGISTIIKKHLSDMVNQLCTTYKVIVKNVIPHELLKQLLQNEKIKNIKIETYKPSNYTIEDSLGAHTDISTEKTITVFPKPFLSDKDFIYKLFSQHQKISRIAGLTNDDETIDNLSIEFNHKILHYNAFTSTKVSENITQLIDDPTNVSTEKLYGIMNEKAFSYLKSAKIIEEIPGCDFSNILTNLINCFEVNENGVIIERNCSAAIT